RRQQHAEALARRATMLEGAIAEAQRADARARLVVRFEQTLAEVETARQGAAEVVDDAPAIDPAVIARLEALRDPPAAWERMISASRKEIIRALAARVTVYPDLAGYFVVVEWRSGGRAAAKVRTMRRRKVFPVPEDVLALFGEPEHALSSMAACS